MGQVKGGSGVPAFYGEGMGRKSAFTCPLWRRNWGRGRDVRITRENLLSIVMQRRSCEPSRGLLRNSAVASLPVVQVLPRSRLVRFRSRRIALTQKPKTAIVVRRYFRATRSSPNTSDLFHQQESVCNLCASGSERGVSSSFRKGSVTRPEGSANSMIKERTFRSYLFRKNFSTHRPKTHLGWQTHSRF